MGWNNVELPLTHIQLVDSLAISMRVEREALEDRCYGLAIPDLRACSYLPRISRSIARKRSPRALHSSAVSSGDFSPLQFR